MNHVPGFRVAIVGLGPRGFGCLERLAIEVMRCGQDLPPLSVTAHDPRPHPGGGPPYDPDQPDGMLLNFSAGHVDIWSDDNELLPAGQRPDFVAWLGRNHPAWASADAFVPRGLLGGYLRDSFESLRAALPPGLGFRHVRGEVRGLKRSAAGWSIRHGDPALDLDGVDQVMVATGHGTWSGNRGFEAWNRELPDAPRTRRIPAVYPVRERLSREAVPDGSVVGVRGFALTAIDATLALSGSRGGTFEEAGPGIPRYHGPETGDVTIVPFSRTGLPPLAKPGPALVQRSSDLAGVWEPLRRGILEADGLTPGALLQQLHRAGARALSALGVRGSGPVLRAGGLAQAGPVGIMERSVLVASGVLPPDETWARGEAWRQAYPVVVARAGEGGLAASFPAPFARLACVMERYAFGPPASNLGRVTALAKAGRLELRAVRAPRIDARDGHLVLHGEGSPLPLDVLVNAVIPPPGVHADTPLLLSLLRQGHTSRAPGWDGLMVSPSAASIGRDGSPTPGLSIVGRATEGWIVGNDTLSRTLHDHTRRWAHRLVAEAGVSVPARAS
ncbi:FAD/NAD(P)-binding domain-containing protein [soil metagenome]